jgi:hypothetical protein
VIRARLVGDARIGAEEGGSEFGYELLDRIGLVAETLAELAIAAALVVRPVLLSITEASPVSFQSTLDIPARQATPRMSGNGFESHHDDLRFDNLTVKEIVENPEHAVKRDALRSCKRS